MFVLGSLIGKAIVPIAIVKGWRNRLVGLQQGLSDEHFEGGANTPVGYGIALGF